MSRSVTNTVVVTLKKENEDRIQNFEDFSDVVLLKLQFDIEDIDQHIKEKTLNIVKLTKFFKKILFISKDIDLSKKIHLSLNQSNRLYFADYSLSDILFENKSDLSYLQLPKDNSARFLISPPHTPCYETFNPLLEEETPKKTDKFNEELLAKGIQTDKHTITILTNSPTGMNITITDCDEIRPNELQDSSNIEKVKSKMPPRSVFDEIDGL
ncbi:hypothetical protein QEN19_001296 [Hanseniaspora menglaensis]